MPLATTSCNMADEPCINNINEIMNKFKDKVDLIVDEGNILEGIPSTIIRVKDKNIEILRKGPINKEELERSIK